MDQTNVVLYTKGLTFETPSGKTEMKLGDGHQGVQGTAYGMTRRVGGKTVITEVIHYARTRSTLRKASEAKSGSVPGSGANRPPGVVHQPLNAASPLFDH